MLLLSLKFVKVKILCKLHYHSTHCCNLFKLLCLTQILLHLITSLWQIVSVSQQCCALLQALWLVCFTAFIVSSSTHLAVLSPYPKKMRNVPLQLSIQRLVLCATQHRTAVNPPVASWRALACFNMQWMQQQWEQLNNMFVRQGPLLVTNGTCMLFLGVAQHA